MKTIKIMKKHPDVSVIMPAFNSEEYIYEAIESILNQSFSDFEFLIIDDGSKDLTVEIVKSFKDDRIILLQHNKNLGNYPARNWGMKLARGKYICVMDSDDLSMPDRIEKQYRFLQNNKEYGICGGYYKLLDSSETFTPPLNYDEIKVWLLSNIIYKHPTIFIKKSLLLKHNLSYDITFRYASDYDFLVRSAGFFPVTNIPEVILKHRKHANQISTAKAKEQANIVNVVRLKQLDNFKLDPTKEEVNIHLSLMNRKKILNYEQFNVLLNWANKLVKHNFTYKYYDEIQLSLFLKSMLKYIQKDFLIRKKESLFYDC